jgi:hypothetical protein
MLLTFLIKVIKQPLKLTEEFNKSMKNTLIALMIGIAIFAGAYIAYPEEENAGSVAQNIQYDYTQLSGSIATTSSVINTGKTTFGSIIVTEDSAVVVEVWDATSTVAIGNPFAVKVADLQASLTEGVYTFDVGLKYGLVLKTTDWTAFAGDWTITYRQGW